MSQTRTPRDKEDKPPMPAKPGAAPARPTAHPKEIGGPKGPEPTRYGDWEVNGRVSDF